MPAANSKKLILIILSSGFVVFLLIFLFAFKFKYNDQNATCYRILHTKLFSVDQKVPEASDLPSLIKFVGPSVVSIYGLDESKKRGKLGTGFVIDDKGTVITNYHVIRNIVQGIVRTKNDQEYFIKGVLAVSQAHDLAMLAIDIPEYSIKPLKLSRNSVQEGEKIFVIGNPVGKENTVSDGIISAQEREGVIQFTAPISPGSSGGPVLNLKGEVVCVVVALTRGAQNLNMCIPVEHVANLSPGNLKSLEQLANYESTQPVKSHFQMSETPVYCCIDSNNAAQFLEDPKQSSLLNYPTCQRVSESDGTVKVTKYESWVFSLIGGNPYTKDLLYETEKIYKKNEPELFERYFNKLGYSYDRINYLNQREYSYWKEHSQGYKRDIYNRVVSHNRASVDRHKYLMTMLGRFCQSAGRCSN
jgi:V8-like Glu-specific endopeptidase